jgi:dolichyl-phosphate beta-glucosyltransferase
VAEDLFAVSSINGYGFDLELLYVAQQRGYTIAEVPVNWADQPGSKVRVLRDGLAMLGELKAIKHNEAKGYYRTPGRADNFQVHPMRPFRLPSS